MGWLLCGLSPNNTTLFIIKNRSPNDITNVLNRSFKRMGAPKRVYADGEGALNSKQFSRFANELT